MVGVTMSITSSDGVCFAFITGVGVTVGGVKVVGVCVVCTVSELLFTGVAILFLSIQYFSAISSICF